MNQQNTFSQIRTVNQYYDRTRLEYNLFWRSHRNLAMHFGYYEQGIDSHDGAVDNLNQKLAKFLNLSSNEVVLDAGSGLGGSALWLAERFNCMVTGVNVVEWQNNIARANAKKRGLEKKLDFMKADYANTKLPSKSFTAFWGVEAIVHAVDKSAVIKEAYRLLKPNGKILISEYILKNEPLSTKERELVQKWLEGWAMPSLMTEDQYLDSLSKTGFRDLSVLDWTDSVRPSLDRLRRFVHLAEPFKKPLRKLNLVNDEQIGNFEASRAQMQTLDRGVWRYKVIVGTK